MLKHHFVEGRRGDCCLLRLVISTLKSLKSFDKKSLKFAWQGFPDFKIVISLPLKGYSHKCRRCFGLIVPPSAAPPVEAVARGGVIVMTERFSWKRSLGVVGGWLWAEPQRS